jgi:BirA family biotin operon repressor/biotin-[acetyl-CoA-carboxylase] ligase
VDLPSQALSLGVIRTLVRMSAARFDDLNRPPLDAVALARALQSPVGPWREIRVVDVTGSTNADLAAAARAGDPGGLVLVAEHQDQGRGRLDRTWVSPPRAGLTFSVLWRPTVDPVRWGWLSPLVGLAVAEAVSETALVDVRLKWPNDLLVGQRKLAGVLAERVGGAVVVGVGLNVSTRVDELVGPAATSLLFEAAACTDRDPLLRSALRRVAERYRDWAAGGGDPTALRQALVERSATVGQEVQVLLPGGRTLRGTATDIDAEGRLVVVTDAGVEAVAAGDVVHLREPPMGPGAGP